MKDSLSSWIVAICAVATLAILINTTYVEENEKTSNDNTTGMSGENEVGTLDKKEADTSKEEVVEGVDNNEIKASNTENEKKASDYNVYIYIVKRGDTYNQICREYGVSLEDLYWQNEWMEDRFAEVGEEIRIPFKK